MLGRILREILSSSKHAPTTDSIRRIVLNVGGGSKSIPIPSHYGNWEHVLLDVDSRGAPFPECQFDAIYCSHNLEHYYRHDGAKVLRGFHHVLKSDGFAEIKVPDLESVMQRVVESNMGLGDVLYISPAGPISVLDVIYGYGKEIEESGRDYYAHKTGFTPKLLRLTLECAGFAAVYVSVDPEAYEARALAFKSEPTAHQRQMFDLPASQG